MTHSCLHWGGRQQNGLGTGCSSDILSSLLVCTALLPGLEAMSKGLDGKGLDEGLHTLITEHAPPQAAPGILHGLGAFKCPLIPSHPAFCTTLSPDPAL